MTDLDYVEERNKLIPFAERFANAKCGAFPPLEVNRDEWAVAWNKAFHGEMSRLAKERGLTSW